MAEKPPLPPLLTAWDGFEDPNFTPIPDSFFDVLLPILTDVEVRVLLYIMRRTYGFRKASDSISLSQIVAGIKKRDGGQLDGGAGVKRDGAIAAVRRLEARGILLVQHNQSAERGNEPTTYRVRKLGQARPLPTPGVGSTEKGGSGSPTPGVGPNEKGESVPPRRGVGPTDLRESAPATRRVGGADSQETVLQETDSQEDSNHIPPPKTQRATRTPAVTSVSTAPDGAVAPTGRYSGPHSAYLAGVIFDHSSELGDAAHKAANSTQAHRLWQASGLDEEAFVALLHAARQRVRTYQGKQGPGTIANKMGYYFRVLAALADVPTELGAGR